MSNETFRRTVRLFLANRGILIDNGIFLIHNGQTIDDEKQVAETLSHAYINILEHTTGNKPTTVLHDGNIELSLAIDLIINNQKTHPSIIKIIDSLTSPPCFFLDKVNVKDVEKLIKKVRWTMPLVKIKHPQGW